MEPLAVRVYQALLLLYPKGFREAYAKEMLLCFQQNLKDAAREKRLLTFWMATLWDLCSSSLQVRMSGGVKMNWARVGAVAAGLALLATLVQVVVVQFCSLRSECMSQDVFLGITTSFSLTVLNFFILLGVYTTGNRGRLEKFAVALYAVFSVLSLIMIKMKISIASTPVTLFLLAVFFALPVIAYGLLSGKIYSQGKRLVAVSATLFCLVEILLLVIFPWLVTHFEGNAILQIYNGMRAIKLLTLAVLALMLWRSSQPQKPKLQTT